MSTRPSLNQDLYLAGLRFLRPEWVVIPKDTAGSLAGVRTGQYQGLALRVAQQRQLLAQNLSPSGYMFSNIKEPFFE